MKPRFRTSLYLFPAGLALTASAAIAQESEGGEEEATIVVTGSGLPDAPSTPAYASQEITREELVSTASGRIEDALSSVAGFQQFRRSDSRSSNPSAQGATLRSLGGNATSRALVLLDGVPMADPFFGFIPFAAIAPERLSSVRVTRGGGSGPFGAGALAGTIELESAGAGTLGDFGGHLYANDRGGTESAAHLSGNLGAGFAVVSGRWDRGKGFFTTPAADRVDASARAAYDSWSVQARGVAPLGDTMELQARALIYDDRRTLRFDGADSSSTGQDASVRLVGRGDWAFDALAYVQARNFTNVVVSSTRFVPVLDQRKTPSTGLGGKIEIRPPVGDTSVLRLGTDYRRSEGELYETALSGFTGAVRERRNAGGTNTDLGFFAENDVLLGRLVLTAGVRLDRYTIREGFFTALDTSGAVIADSSFANRSGWEESFRGGATFDAGGGLKLRAAAYTGLRLPTLNELYRPFVVFPVTTNANPALANEKLKGFEAGIDFAPGDDFEFSLTAFDNRVKDAIANVTLDPVTRQRQNIEEIHAQGIEARAAFSLGPLQVVGSLAYTDAEAREAGAAFDGNRPSQTPAWVGGAMASYRFLESGLIAVTLRHIGKQFEDDLESDVLPSVTTLGAYAEMPVADRFSLVLRGENLTDEEIITRNQGGSIDLGTPRTIWFGLKIEG
ncbi:TonB-dependent receptor plug domain-containing protein [Qipengyuania vesicularis]|uniref:TonB-dependent receptor plug domain-containing protein n=1 Tax=Qipengyuania vesicularis TaxID=2867232 RepID=UPI001C86F7C3|nr:TonB-dependent receptor [Qipengyuania vesicularis]MBX7526070.1 TonB-dependent receptor [Qipengyuania vesicularis]